MNIDSSGPITIVTLLYFHALSWYKYLAVYSELKWKFQLSQSNDNIRIHLFIVGSELTKSKQSNFQKIKGDQVSFFSRII